MLTRSVQLSCSLELLTRAAQYCTMYTPLDVDHCGPSDLKPFVADLEWEMHFRQHDRTQLVQ